MIAPILQNKPATAAKTDEAPFDASAPNTLRWDQSAAKHAGWLPDHRARRLRWILALLFTTANTRLGLRTVSDRDDGYVLLEAP